jgi:hypothetical protein
MRQGNPTTPDGCSRCSAVSVCTAHEAYATAERPSTADLLGIVARDAAAVRVRPFATGEGPVEDHNPMVPRRENEWRGRSPWRD